MRELVSQINMYPLAEFDGKMKRHDWSKVPKFPGAESKEEVRWVFPDKFVDQLPAVLRDAPPLPGEEARYAEMLFVIDAANKSPTLKQAITDEVTKADQALFDWEQKQGPATRRRRFAHYLCAGRRAERSRSAEELAAITEEQRFFAFPARLLGRARCTRRHMDTASGRESEITK